MPWPAPRTSWRAWRPSSRSATRRSREPEMARRVALFKPEARPATSTGAAAVGALAVGATALGAVAIGRLTIKRAVIKHLEIEELEVGGLRGRGRDPPPSP